jgi:hypothetical protein
MSYIGMKKGLIVILVLTLFLVTVSGHGEDNSEEPNHLEYIGIASLVIVVLTLLSFKKKLSESMKWMLFAGFIVAILFPTVYLTWSTISLNITSETGGPVHWHADFEVWNCGEKLDLINPEGLLNRVGTSVFHEHNDDRIHVEGTILDTASVDLHSFFDVVGGRLEDTSFVFPSEAGRIESGGCEGELQIFVYKVLNPDDRDSMRYVQEKVSVDYVLSPHSNIPPGDCIIIEFGEIKEKTDKLCKTYEVAVEKGRLEVENGS